MKLLGAKLAEISQRDSGGGGGGGGVGGTGGYDQWGSPILRPAHLEIDSTVLHSNIVNNLNRTTFADLETPFERGSTGAIPAPSGVVVVDNDCDIRYSSLSGASSGAHAGLKSDNAFKV